MQADFHGDWNYVVSRTSQSRPLTAVSTTEKRIPSEAVLQQTPATQKPLEHWLVVVHELPWVCVVNLRRAQGRRSSDPAREQDRAVRQQAGGLPLHRSRQSLPPGCVSGSSSQAPVFTSSWSGSRCSRPLCCPANALLSAEQLRRDGSAAIAEREPMFARLTRQPPTQSSVPSMFATSV